MTQKLARLASHGKKKRGRKNGEADHAERRAVLKTLPKKKDTQNESSDASV